MKQIKFFLLLITLFFINHSKAIVICTCADELYFEPLINLIGSIHKVDFDNLQEICVYDLGMTKEQRDKIGSIQKVNLYKVDMVNPKLLKPVIIDVHGKSARGWYAFKPVIIKQTLEKYESILYMDAGNTVLSSLLNLYKHIEENGHFILSGAPHNLMDWITKRVIKHFDLESEKNKLIINNGTKSISANIIGLSRKYYNNLVLPMYNHAKDLYLFEDDGSGIYGFGKSRHDQTLFSIYSYLLNLKINNQGYSFLKVNNKKIMFHTHYYNHLLNSRSVIYQSRWDLDYSGKKTVNNEPYYTQFIKFTRE